MSDEFDDHCPDCGVSMAAFEQMRSALAKAEGERAEALGTADGYREACERAEAERDAWHHKCDVAVAAVVHVETERDHLVEQRGVLQEYSNAGYAENERLRSQLAALEEFVLADDILAKWRTGQHTQGAADTLRQRELLDAKAKARALVEKSR